MKKSEHSEFCHKYVKKNINQPNSPCMRYTGGTSCTVCCMFQVSNCMFQVSNCMQAANLRDCHASMNHRFEGRIPDFMDGIPDLIEGIPDFMDRIPRGKYNFNTF